MAARWEMLLSPGTHTSPVIGEHGATVMDMGGVIVSSLGVKDLEAAGATLIQVAVQALVVLLVDQGAQGIQ